MQVNNVNINRETLRHKIMKRYTIIWNNVWLVLQCTLLCTV